MSYVLGDGLDYQTAKRKRGFRAYGYEDRSHPEVTSPYFVCLSELAPLGTAMALVFIDEYPDSMFDLTEEFNINYNPFVVHWRNLPATYHNGGCTMVFADGHAEYKRWVAPATRQPVRYIGWTYLSLNSDALAAMNSDRRDFEWLAHRMFVPSALIY
jgi:prepilin-type processing-associated H-X9-DG protein